jgi:hypothetical protein
MGSPTLYWYPPGSARLRTITLSHMTGAAYEEDRDTITSQSVSGQSRRLDFGGRRRIRLTMNLIPTEATFRELDALVAHAKRGGAFGFSVDHAKSWATILNRAPSAGDTALVHNSNAFAVWSSSAVVASGDVVRIEGPPPTDCPELCAVSSLGAVLLTLSEALRGTPEGGTILARYRDFYPVLYLQDGAAEPLTSDNDRRMLNRLTLECFEPAGDLLTAVQSAALLGGATTPFGSTGPMRLGLDDLIANLGTFNPPNSLQKPLGSTLTNYFAPRRS